MMGQRYLGNLAYKEVHDLDNEKTNCEIGKIIAAKNDVPFNWLSRANDKGYDNCAYCLGRSTKQLRQKAASTELRKFQYAITQSLLTIFSPKLLRNCFICKGESILIQSRSLKIPSSFTALTFLASVSPCWIAAVPAVDAQTGNGSDYEGPVGVTGIFNGNVTTACSYDPLTHNAKRTVTDIIVPGSVGKYPLKMTRYYNSRTQYYGNRLGHGWEHEYDWLLWASGHKVASPNGSVYDDYCDGPPLGVSERWEQRTDTYNGNFRLGDGGTVVFENGRAKSIVDPYGQTTRISRDLTGDITQVTEPGGRYLAFTYGDSDSTTGARLITKVDANDGLGHVIESVTYTYTTQSTGTGSRRVKVLTSVTYSDGNVARYTYQGDNNTYNGGTWPLLSTCDDVRYNGPMRQISYQYVGGIYSPHGQVVQEKNKGTGQSVSKIDPVLPSTLDKGEPPSQFTETRGDGPQRTFTYTRFTTLQDPENTSVCPEMTNNNPPQRFLLNYTDFQGHATTLSYDTNWFVNSVTDANTHTTDYLRGLPPPNGIGEILKITHPPDDSGYRPFVTYGYSTDPHYVVTITDEKGNVTSHTRDPVSHQITQTVYKNSLGTVLASETFTYNTLGQVLTHRLKNGAYERFACDTRGLLTDKWNPKLNSVPLDSDPHTHFDYYTSGGWTDRVKTMTLPANASNLQASETYEYDHNSSGGAVGGRGLVTKITHADTKYQSFDYDIYGNKLSEENELRQQTTHIYDEYNRLNSTTRIMSPSPNETTTYSYEATVGSSNLSATLHTTSSVHLVTTPMLIKTENRYDANFRKISTTEGYGTLNLTTISGYDNVGNLTTVTDPLTHTTVTGYDNRNRKKTVTEASGTNLAMSTTWSYDNASNISNIRRNDGTNETKTYDGLNRVLTDTVPQTAAVNLTTWFIYNPSGTIRTVTDARGSGPGDPNYTTTFEYDASDQKTKMTYPNGDSQSWSYDNAHNLANRTTVGGKTQSFGFDNRNRKTTMRWDLNANVPEWADFGYDDASRLTSAKNGTGTPGTGIISTITRSYDAAGRLKLDQQAVTGLASKAVNYLYDKDGKETHMYVTGASYDYTFGYDPMGRFSTIAPTGSATAFQYQYDPASNEIERDNLINSVAQTYGRTL
jgi:YD repeat-containing protein